jgi:acyl-CoA thioester hydrolase
VDRPVFVFDLVALPEHIDELGHVNNAVWVQWIQQAATLHWEEAADPVHKAAFFWVVVRHEIDYLRAAFEGQAVVARTWIEGEPRGARSFRLVEFADAAGGPVMVRARTGWAMIDRANGRPARVPRAVVAPFLGTE